MTTYAGISTNYYINVINNRCGAFFTEPAMCSRYLAIPYIVNIVKEKKFFSFTNIVYSFAILFTLSGNAIIALIVGYALLFFYLLRKKDFIGKIKAICVILFAFGAFIVLKQIPLFQNLFARVNEISGDSSFSSGYIRIVRGFEAFANLPLFYKIFGIGFGNYNKAMQLYFYEVIMHNTSLVVYWINGIQNYFIFGGLISVIIFLAFLFPTFFKEDIRLRSVSILFLVYLFVAGMFNEPLWLIFMLVVLSSKQRIYAKKQKKENGKNDFRYYSYAQSM